MNRMRWYIKGQLWQICPTRVGMNQYLGYFVSMMRGHLPHTRGDEPATYDLIMLAPTESAPHAWG